MVKRKRPAYRTRTDQVLRRPTPTAMPDNVERLIAGVRITGSDAVHALVDGLPACGGNTLAPPRHQMVFTTAPVTCRRVRCGEHA